MSISLEGGAFFDPRDVAPEEYLPNRGVFLAGLLGKHRGDGFGLYHGRIEPGARIAPEIHPDTSETIYILSGRGVGLVGERRVPLTAGQVLHVDKNVTHGLENAGTGVLEFLVIGHPDF